MGNKISVQFNLFGPYISAKEIPYLIKGYGLDQGQKIVIQQLELFFNFPFSSLTEDILQRYSEITTEEMHINIAATSEKIYEKITSPINSAKKNYCFGDYLSTIAVSGIVGEMLTILLWKINPTLLKGDPLSNQREGQLLGRSFENLGQERRLNILLGLEYITPKQYEDLNYIREKRRRYLHFWTNNGEAKRDAIEILKRVIQTYKEIMGVKLVDAGTVKIENIKLFQYLGSEPTRKY